jgi:hypothetical protein
MRIFCREFKPLATRFLLEGAGYIEEFDGELEGSYSSGREL